MYEIFAELLERMGKRPIEVSRATGIPSSTFSDWKKGKSKPNAEKMLKIATYLGVSIEYLMTGNDNEPKKESNPYGDIKGVYLSYAKEAQDSGIDPDDIRLALDTIKRLRGDKK